MQGFEDDTILFKTISKVRTSIWVYLKYDGIDTLLLPQVTIFNEDPVLIFKNKYPDLTRMKSDEIEKKWKDFIVENNSDKIYNMDTHGAYLCSMEKGLHWIVTTTFRKGYELYLWSKKVKFKGGNAYITFKSSNKIKL